jgi:hypothetical protein
MRRCDFYVTMILNSVVDPGRVGSASFCRIRIWIVQGKPIRIRPIRIVINARHMKKFANYNFFHKISIFQCFNTVCYLKYLNYEIFDRMRIIKHSKLEKL